MIGLIRFCGCGLLLIGFGWVRLVRSVSDWFDRFLIVSVGIDRLCVGLIGVDWRLLVFFGFRLVLIGFDRMLIGFG